MRDSKDYDLNAIAECASVFLKNGIRYCLPEALEIRNSVEDIRETTLTVPCDERFSGKSLAKMIMIKNVHCERVLGFDAK